MNNQNIIELKSFNSINDLVKENNGVIFNNLSFSVQKEQIVSICAPFGSGKSTLLKIIAKNNSNNIFFNGKRLYFIPSYSVYLENVNVEDALKIYSDSTNIAINDVIKYVGLEGYEKHKFNKKSKGFYFRVLLALGILLNAELFIIDDIFNEINYITKIEVMELILKLRQEKGISFLFGISNITDAIILSDKIIIAKGNPFEIIFEENISSNKLSLKERMVDEKTKEIKNNVINKLEINEIKGFAI